MAFGLLITKRMMPMRDGGMVMDRSRMRELTETIFSFVSIRHWTMGIATVALGIACCTFF